MDEIITFSIFSLELTSAETRLNTKMTSAWLGNQKGVKCFSCIIQSAEGLRLGRPTVQVNGLTDGYLDQETHWTLQTLFPLLFLYFNQIYWRYGISKSEISKKNAFQTPPNITIVKLTSSVESFPCLSFQVHFSNYSRYKLSNWKAELLWIELHYIQGRNRHTLYIHRKENQNILSLVKSWFCKASTFVNRLSSWKLQQDQFYLPVQKLHPCIYSPCLSFCILLLEHEQGLTI